MPQRTAVRLRVILNNSLLLHDQIYMKDFAFSWSLHWRSWEWFARFNSVNHLWSTALLTANSFHAWSLDPSISDWAFDQFRSRIRPFSSNYFTKSCHIYHRWSIITLFYFFCICNGILFTRQTSKSWYWQVSYLQFDRPFRITAHRAQKMWQTCPDI